jgi:excisionase family DNA binding protein
LDEISNERQDPAGDAWGRRVRAALVLRNYDPDDLARELNISRRTLDRMLVGLRKPKAWETARVEELLELPPWFISHGVPRVVEPSVAVEDAAVGADQNDSAAARRNRKPRTRGGPSSATPESRRLYSPQEVAEMWGLSRASVLRMIQRGEIRAIRMGGLLRVAPGEIERYERREGK